LVKFQSAEFFEIKVPSEKRWLSTTAVDHKNEVKAFPPFSKG
jgi:hypothetical protein